MPAGALQRRSLRRARRRSFPRAESPREDHPEVRMSAKELSELIRQLPTGYQTIFNLHAVEGYTHVEIGGILGIHEGTSRSQYARARALLITWIENKNSDSKTERYARTKF